MRMSLCMQEKRLRVENMRLRRELAQAKSAASSAAGPTGSTPPSGKSYCYFVRSSYTYASWQRFSWCMTRLSLLFLQSVWESKEVS